MADIPLDLIDAHPEARPIDPAGVAKLALSIGEGGLINPVLLRPVGDRYQSIAGGHRIEATRELFDRGALAEPTIRANVREMDDDDAMLVMIDENLMRIDLTPAERAMQTAKRKEIYERKHPETKQGAAPGNQYTGKGMEARQLGGLPNAPENKSFTAATAAATGTSERAIQRDAERGKMIAPEILDKIIKGGKAGERLNTGTYLDGLKKLNHAEQQSKVQVDLRSKQRTVSSQRTRARKRRELAEKSMEEQEVEKAVERLKKLWIEANEEVRNRFIAWLDKMATSTAKSRKLS